MACLGSTLCCFVKKCLTRVETVFVDMTVPGSFVHAQPMTTSRASPGSSEPRTTTTVDKATDAKIALDEAEHVSIGNVTGISAKSNVLPSDGRSVIVLAATEMLNINNGGWVSV